MLAVKEQNPELDIRFVFQRNNTLSKNSKTTYGAQLPMVLVVHISKHSIRLVRMTDTPTALLVEIDQLVARLEEDFPPQLIFEALEEYMELADDLGYFR